MASIYQFVQEVNIKLAVNVIGSKRKQSLEKANIK